MIDEHKDPVEIADYFRNAASAINVMEMAFQFPIALTGPNVTPSTKSLRVAGTTGNPKFVVPDSQRKKLERWSVRVWTT
jgi:hypothetical protein